MTRTAISRRAFQREARERYGLTAAQAREHRRLFEAHTGEVASRKGLLAHPRIAAAKVRYAKAAVTRKAKKREKEKKGVEPKRTIGETGRHKQRRTPMKF